MSPPPVLQCHPCGRRVSLEDTGVNVTGVPLIGRGGIAFGRKGVQMVCVEHAGGGCVLQHSPDRSTWCPVSLVKATRNAVRAEKPDMLFLAVHNYDVKGARDHRVFGCACGPASPMWPRSGPRPSIL